MRFLLSYRRFIVWSVLLATVAVAVFSLVVPSKFRSTAQILPPTDEQDLLSTTSVLQSTSLSKMLRLGGTIRGGTPSDLLAALFRSRTVQERVLELSNFKTEYKIRKKGVEEALKALDKFTSVSSSDEGIVRISVDAKRPELAAKLVNTYVAEVDRVLRESNMSRSRSVRIFIGQRLAQGDSELAVAGDSLIRFQQEHKVVLLDEETKASVEAYVKLKTQEMGYALESDIADRVLQPDNPYSRQLKRQSSAMRSQLSAFENGTPQLRLRDWIFGPAEPVARSLRALRPVVHGLQAQAGTQGTADRAVRAGSHQRGPGHAGNLHTRRSQGSGAKSLSQADKDDPDGAGRQLHPCGLLLAAALEGIRAGSRIGLENPESAGFVSRLPRESRLMARLLAFFTGEPGGASGRRPPSEGNRSA